MISCSSVLKCGTTTLDINKRVLASDVGELILPKQMFRLAERIMERPGIVVERSSLIEAMYAGDDEPENPDDVLEKNVRRLRYALSLLSRENISIQAVNGVGYRVNFGRG